MRSIRRALFTGLFAAVSATVLAQAPSHSPALRSVLQDLASSTRSDYHRQITTAIDCSPELAQEMNKRAIAGGLTQIRVVPTSELKQSGRPFLAYAQRSAIVIAEGLLEDLRKDRLFDVVDSDDIPPNNTAFVLRHLLQHLAEPIEPSAFGNPVAYANARIDSEARAWIHGWNALVDCARQRNGKPLSGRQGGKLLLNFRYRAILFRAAGIPKEAAQGRPTVRLTEESTIEPSAANVSAMAETLKGSKMIDVE